MDGCQQGGDMLMRVSGRAIFHGPNRPTPARRIPPFNGRSLSSLHSQQPGRSTHNGRPRMHCSQGTPGGYQSLECWFVGNSPGRRTASGSRENPGRSLGRKDRSSPAIGTATLHATTVCATGRARTPADSRGVPRILGGRTRWRSHRHWSSGLCRIVATDFLAGLSTSPDSAIPRTVRRPFWLTNDWPELSLPATLNNHRGGTT